MPRYRDPDDDTDPDGPSQSQSGRHRIAQEALTEEGAAVAEGSRGAWRLVLLFAAFATLGAGLFVVDGVHAAYEAGKAVAPVEKKLDDHLSAMAGERRMMDLYVTQQSKAIESMNRKLDALCRASAKPAVCLGEN